MTLGLATNKFCGWGHPGHDRMAIGFTTTCAIRASLFEEFVIRLLKVTLNLSNTVNLM
jgi:hypothetical protein